MRSLATLALALPLVVGCAGSNVTKDHTPVPQARGAGIWSSNVNAVSNAGHTLEYILGNTNSQLPPYETLGDSWNRGWATANESFDSWFLNYDWNDPYAEDY